MFDGLGMVSLPVGSCLQMRARTVPSSSFQKQSSLPSTMFGCHIEVAMN